MLQGRPALFRGTMPGVRLVKKIGGIRKQSHSRPSCASGGISEGKVPPTGAESCGFVPIGGQANFYG